MVHRVSQKLSYKRIKYFIVSYRLIGDNCENLKCHNGEQHSISSHSLLSKNAFCKCSLVLRRVWSTVVLCHHLIWLCIPVEGSKNDDQLTRITYIEIEKWILNGSSWIYVMFPISKMRSNFIFNFTSFCTYILKLQYWHNKKHIRIGQLKVNNGIQLLHRD